MTHHAANASGPQRRTLDLTALRELEAVAFALGVFVGAFFGMIVAIAVALVVTL